mmetsp:Transcript_5526/g.13003  ORF Transcript_5526/g.13003 Transcript_5526/m.13003 type:complete len:94 (+) Transcript_5526:211-492(+)
MTTSSTMAANTLLARLSPNILPSAPSTVSSSVCLSLSLSLSLALSLSFSALVLFVKIATAQTIIPLLCPRAYRPTCLPTHLPTHVLNLCSLRG